MAWIPMRPKPAGMAIQMIQAGSCMAGVSCSLQWILMTDSMPA